MAGVPLRAVQALMGHKCIETTLRYSHLGETELHKAVECLTASTTDSQLAPGELGNHQRQQQLRHKSFEMFGAQERTRTSTTLRPLAPEASASASSATWAQARKFQQFSIFSRRLSRCQSTMRLRSGSVFRLADDSPV